MNSYKIILLLLSLLLLPNCSPKPTPITTQKKIQGLWCDEQDQPHFFLEKECLLNRLGFVPYIVSDSSIIIQRKEGRDEYRLTTPHPDTLLIWETKAKRRQRLYRPKRNNSITFTAIEYAQLTAFDSFATIITMDGRVDLTITFHPTMETGFYQGQLDEKYIFLLQELLASLDPVVEPVFNPYIISDIQEWAAVLHSETADSFQLYHNYQGIDAVQKSLASLLNFLPNLVQYQKVREGKNKTHTIQAFRKDEAQRNLQDLVPHEKK